MERLLLPERDEPLLVELEEREREALARDPLDRDRADVDRVPDFERAELDRDPLVRDLVDRDPLERDRDEDERDPLERFAPEREPPRLPPEREDDLRVVERPVVDRLAVLELLRAALAAGGGEGVAGGGIAEAVAARPPAIATRGSQPSSVSASNAPTVMAIAAASPRKMPTFRVGDPATMRQRISSTARVPSRAVTVPRRSGMFTRCPAAARHDSAMPETPERMIRKPGRSVSASQPLIPVCDSVRSPDVPVSSAPPLYQSKNRNTKRAMPPMPATISPARSRDESKSLTPVDEWGPRVRRDPRTEHGLIQPRPGCAVSRIPRVRPTVQMPPAPC